MEDSRYHRQISRALYSYRKLSKQIIKSRTYALGNSIKIIAKEPVRFAGKSVKMVFTNPQKLYRVISGAQTLQRNKEIQEQLKGEYAQWVEDTELSPKALALQCQDVKKFKKQPLVSLITPVFNPPVDAHVELIESVLNQTYENFELLLFNFGDKPEIENLLNEYAAKDSRVIVKHGLKNKGIGANSNFCLDYAKGEFLGLLDHDDALTPNALYECIKALNNTDTDFIYTDKDKITEDGDRFEPLFKPDWSPEMALCGNYMTHFNLMRTSLVKKLGGWDPETDGAQDWDLFLRLTIESDKPVVHVPKIVYHWRTVIGSTSTGIGAKPYVIKAQQKAVNKHFKSLGVKALAQHDELGQVYVDWQYSEPKSLVIINCIYEDFHNTEQIIRDLTTGHSKIVLFIPEDVEIPKKEKEAHKPLNFDEVRYKTGEFIKSVWNYLKDAEQDYVVYLDDSIRKVDSTKADNSWTSQLLGWLKVPGVGIAGGGVYSESGVVIDVGSFYDTSINNFVKYHFATGHRSGYNGYIQWTRNFILPSERLFGFAKKLLIKIPESELGVRDDEFQKLLALKNFSRGNRGVYDPTLVAIGSAPFEIRLPMSKQLSKNKPSIQNDHYYNANLNKDYRDPKPFKKSEPVLQEYYLGTE